MAHPGLQHLELHAQRARRRGARRTSITITRRADRERRRALRDRAALAAASRSSPTNHVLRRGRCSSSAAATASARPASSRAESISVDLVLTILGVSLAAFWNWNPWLDLRALAPLVVVHRSLSVPQLQAEARVDPKTGLYNARYFATTLAAEIARAARFERPMSLIMADLDLLRDINNSYGHLAGDAVLKGIAEIFRQQLRHYDVPARFGGEEFSILLPGDSAGAGDGDRRADPPRRRRARVRGRDGGASRSARRCRSASPASRRTASTRTS